uniref:Uncharacterized protein n=1 Tax=Rhizophora mucronata TaxID=61149 RepID=A0A2P2QR94_RHIMU
MQTFMIPGTVFMSLLAGALFGAVKGVALVVFAATAGASSCYVKGKLTIFWFLNPVVGGKYVWMAIRFRTVVV